MPLSPYHFHAGIVMRSPLQAITQKTATLQEFTKDKHFKEALFLSSPVLYQRLMQYENGHPLEQAEVEKLTKSLHKYWKRMCTRMTPFGLFAGCGVAYWSDLGASLKLSDKKFNRRSRLDMGFLCDLAHQIEQDPEIQDHLCYYPNSSIYIVGEDFRFLESNDRSQRTSFKVSSVSCSSHLNHVLTLAQEGVSLMELIGYLVSVEGVATDQARQYVEELVECQLLVSELQPSVTGREFFQGLINIMSRISESAPRANYYLKMLSELQEELLQMDERKINDISDYKRLESIVNDIGLKAEAGKFIQVDSFLDLDQKTVSRSIQKSLKEGIMALMTCGKPYHNQDLKNFIDRFRARFDSQVVPLGVALDPESGIGYPKSLDSDMCSLLNDLPVKESQKRETIWDNYEQWSLDVLTAAQTNKGEEVMIDQSLLKQFPEEAHDLPPSLPVVFRMVDHKDSTVQIESAGGSSAVNYLGRFAHGHKDIAQMVEDIVSKEQENNPEVIFAEIAHLPESRTGNILQRPNVRGYEIPYLAKSAMDEDHQVSIQDLYLKLAGNKLQLWSKKLGKRIIPRLGTAHNFSRTNLPIYKLLCDLQTQEQDSSLTFNWGSLSSQFNFFPRVKHKNIILSSATWRFGDEDLTEMIKSSGTSEKEALDKLIREWEIPSKVTWSEGDQDLFLDLDVQADRELLFQLARKNGKLVLKEYLGNEDGIVTDQEGKPYAVQMIACLVSDQPIYKVMDPIKFPSVNQEVQRKFAPGSEWIYYKLYCSPSVMDRILNDAVQPALQVLYENQKIDRWFFVRYDDGESHLRVRLHLTDEKQFEEATRSLREVLADLEKSQIIWRTELATYERELERYGTDTMGYCENIFHWDSELANYCVQVASNSMNDDLRWQISLTLIDSLYEAFGIDRAKKLEMAERGKNAFYHEFEVDKDMKRYLDTKFRDNRELISSSIDSRGSSLGEHLHALIQRRFDRLREIVPTLVADLQSEGTIPVESLIDSLVHMLVNKIMGSRQRFYEMVIYHFMTKYYRSEVARSNQVSRVA